MFADPQSLTINAVANSLPRTGSGVDEGKFSKDDGNVKLTIKHSTTGARVRRLIRADQRKVAADPLSTGFNKEYSQAVYLVIDQPLVGFSNAEIKYLVDALSAWLTASSGANVTKVVGGES